MVLEGGAQLATRIDHLLNCLRLTHNITNAICGEFDHSIRFSVAASGEVIVTTILAECVVQNLAGTLGLKRFVFQQWRLYLEPGGELESYIIAHEWCPSEVERLSQSVPWQFSYSLLKRFG